MGIKTHRALSKPQSPSISPTTIRTPMEVVSVISSMVVPREAHEGTISAVGRRDVVHRCGNHNWCIHHWRGRSTHIDRSWTSHHLYRSAHYVLSRTCDDLHDGSGIIRHRSRVCTPSTDRYYHATSQSLRRHQSSTDHCSEKFHDDFFHLLSAPLCISENFLCRKLLGTQRCLERLSWSSGILARWERTACRTIQSPRMAR